MLAIFADESDDGHTYALGGWAITPTQCQTLDDQWRAMLQTIKLADGSPCCAFHASAMMRCKRPFDGWIDADICAAFEKATALIKKNRDWVMKPVGVAVEIPATFTDVPRDSIWLMLFANLFRVVFETEPGAMSIEFVFDEKKSIAKYAAQLHKTVLDLLAPQLPGKFLDSITMRPDNDAPRTSCRLFDLRVATADLRCSLVPGSARALVVPAEAGRAAERRPMVFWPRGL